MFTMDPIKRDALQEIGNIGLGHAVTALSELTGETFLISVPVVRQLSTSEIPFLFGEPEAIVVGASCLVNGDWAGHGAFLFPWDSICDLWERLLNDKPTNFSELTEMHASMVSEIANIMVAAYVAAIGEFTGFKLIIEPPSFVADMSAAVLSALAVEALMSDRELLSIQTEFSSFGLNVVGQFMFLPETGGLGKIFSALGIA